MPTAFGAVDRNLKHGCGKTLVVDGNKKNHDNVCLAGNAGYAEYIPGRVQTGCPNSPVYKTQFCLHKPNLLNSLISLEFQVDTNELCRPSMQQRKDCSQVKHHTTGIVWLD